MQSFGTPQKLKPLKFESNDEKGAVSVDRHQRAMNDRDRRRQIIAKLAQKRKQYQSGIGKAERESYQRRVKTSIIRHKQQISLNRNKMPCAVKPIKPILLSNGDEYKKAEEEYEEEEHKSMSISTSISPSRPRCIVVEKCQNPMSKSTSASPKNVKHAKYLHNIHADDDDTLCSDGRDEELAMLRAQNQRLSNKLEHVNTELIETKVFLRSERKRNKQLFDDVKLKEREINELSESIDSLEMEIEQKDNECIECMEKLSMTEAENKKLSKLKDENENISIENEEWQQKYYQTFEKYSSLKSTHKQKIHELKEQNIDSAAKMNKMDSELSILRTQNQAFMDSMLCITKIMQNHIKSDDESDHSVSKQLHSMQIEELSQDTMSSKIERGMNMLLQSLIGVVDKGNTLNQDNKELSSCLIKYENDINEQQQRMQEIQKNYEILSNEHNEMKDKYQEMNKELKRTYETMFTSTDELQTIACQFSERNEIGDVDMSECIQIISESIQDERVKSSKLKQTLFEFMKKYHDDTQSLQLMVRQFEEKCDEKVFVLQDNLSKTRLQMLKQNGVNASKLSNMSMISADLNVSNIEDIQSQFADQMQLINSLREDLKDKQQRINGLLSKSDDIQQSNKDKQMIKALEAEIVQIKKERDCALNDFQSIVDEWQNMQGEVEETFIKNEALQNEINDIEKWINLMVGSMKQIIDGSDMNSFETMSKDIPKKLNDLHSVLTYVLPRISLFELNTTKVEENNDDIFLDQLFGKIRGNEVSVIEDTKKQDELKSTICEIEAKLCLEEIVHNVELSHVGNEAEKLISAYQHRLKSYHGFIKELKSKMADSSKQVHSLSLERDHSWSECRKFQSKAEELANQIHSLSLERDHSWSQCQKLQIKVDDLSNVNAELEQKLVLSQQNLLKKTEAFKAFVLKTESEKESMDRQNTFNQETNENLNERLNESSKMLQEVSAQRDHLEAQCVSLSKKFMEYKHTMDMLFKRSCQTLIQYITPLMCHMNGYSLLNQRVIGMTQAVQCIKLKLSQDKKADERSDICKRRVLADVHRFPFHRTMHVMKQKYCAQIETLQSELCVFTEKFQKIQDSYSLLETSFEKQKESKKTVESQLISIKKSFNAEIVNYQNVQQRNQQNEERLNGQIDALQKQINEQRDKYSLDMQHENEQNMKQRQELQSKLNEQCKKSKKLHGKAVKYQNEAKEIRIKCNQLNAKNADYQKQINQLESLNNSLKEAIDTKTTNQSRLNEIYNTKTKDLKQSMAEIEAVNKQLNEQSELQQHEIEQYENQIQQVQKSNREFAERLEVVKSERLQDERAWFDKEEDLRNEVHIIRDQLHSTTNELGMMKLDMLEKDTANKKLKNEIDGLNEELLFYKECQQKDKNDKSNMTKSHQDKLNELKMLLDAKGVRITQLQEDNESKTRKIKDFEMEIIELQNQISSTNTMMQRENNLNQTLKNEKKEQIQNRNKLQMVIDDLTNELESIKTEKRKLFTELNEQKSVNVQLSIELDSMQKYLNDPEPDPIKKSIEKSVMDDALNKYSTISFFDADLENDDNDEDVDLNGSDISLNLSATTKDILRDLKMDSENILDNDSNVKKKRRRRPGLPLPNIDSTATSQSSPCLPSAYEVSINGEERMNDY